MPCCGQAVSALQPAALCLAQAAFDQQNDPRCYIDAIISESELNPPWYPGATVDQGRRKQTRVGYRPGTLNPAAWMRVSFGTMLNSRTPAKTQPVPERPRKRGQLIALQMGRRRWEGRRGRWHNGRSGDGAKTVMTGMLVGGEVFIGAGPGARLQKGSVIPGKQPLAGKMMVHLFLRHPCVWLDGISLWVTPNVARYDSRMEGTHCQHGTCPAHTRTLYRPDPPGSNQWVVWSHRRHGCRAPPLVKRRALDSAQSRTWGRLMPDRQPLVGKKRSHLSFGRQPYVAFVGT